MSVMLASDDNTKPVKRLIFYRAIIATCAVCGQGFSVKKSKNVGILEPYRHCSKTCEQAAGMVEEHSHE